MKEKSLLFLLQQEDFAVKEVNSMIGEMDFISGVIESLKRKGDEYKGTYRQDKELLELLLQDNKEDVSRWEEKLRICKKEEEKRRENLFDARKELFSYIKNFS